MPGNLNDRVPREHAKIPNVRNWAVRDYGYRVGVWGVMEVFLPSRLSRRHEPSGDQAPQLLTVGRTDS